MSEIITCPLPEGMARRGSPVVHHDGMGVVCYISGDAVGVFNDWLGVVRDCHPGMLKMDLTDQTGRAHAAWWLAGHFNMDAFCVAPVLWHQEQSWGHDWVLHAGEHEMAFGVQAALDDLREYIGPENWTDDPAVIGLMVVPAIADLDPTDDTRLPDGSRVVDALALKAVVEHLIAQRSAK